MKIVENLPVNLRLRPLLEKIRLPVILDINFPESICLFAETEKYCMEYILCIIWNTEL